MIDDRPWTIRFNTYDRHTETRRETLFALGNGIFVLRGAAPFAPPGRYHYRGLYLAGGYARFAADIAGETVKVESLANLPDPLTLTFRIDGGAWFDMDAAELEDYRHELDLRGGLSRRSLTCRWEGRRLRLDEQRLVSMAEPDIAAIQLRLEPEEWSGGVEFRAAIDGSVANRNVERYSPYPSRHLEAPEVSIRNGTGLVRTRLRGTGTIVTVAQRLHEGEGEGAATATGVEQLIARQVAPGSAATVTKLIGLGSSLTGDSDIEEHSSFGELAARHRRTWHALWTAVGINAEDTAVSRALRFHAFHLLQTVSPHSRGLDAGIPPRGWHGEGYRGHIFWDELFVFPFLLSRFPDVARAKLLHRFRRLDAAREAAQAAGFSGAMFPWRSASDGREVTPRWQWNLLSRRWMRDHTELQRHVGSAVAYNFWQHYLATGEVEFLARCGAETILEVARFWASRVEYDPKSDRYDIRGVVGPDEFHTAYPDAASPGLDNNAYTNLTAVWTLCRALEVLDHLPSSRAAELREQLALTDEEMATWDRISRRMRLVFHGDGILSQFERFGELQRFRRNQLPGRFAGERHDWALEAVGDDPNAYQFTKQADALTLFHLFPADEVCSLMSRLGYEFTREAMLRTCRYYLDRTRHRSSLSRIVYAGALAEVDPEASWCLFREALGTDLHEEPPQSVAEGVHLGAMGGTLDVLQRRYYGVSPHEDGIRFVPSLPEDLCPMRLRLKLRGFELAIEGREGQIELTSHRSNHGPLRVTGEDTSRDLRPGESIVADCRQPSRDT